MSKRLGPSAAVFLTALLVSACSTAPSRTPPGSVAQGSPAPSATTPSTGAIAHPTGATEIVFRYDVGGGFVPMSFFAAHVPVFTLYGDGTVIWASSGSPLGSGLGPGTGQPIRIGRFSEDQVQEFLAFALGDGGLAIARDSYTDSGGIADAPSTSFIVNADGRTRTVSVYALGIETQPGPDTAIKARFKKIVERIVVIDGGGTAGAAYVATAYRGVLEEAAGAVGVQVRDWPWPSITPAEFVVRADPGGFQRRTRVLTPAEATVLGVTGFENGITGGLYLKGPDGAIYSLALRPLLPDESS